MLLGWTFYSYCGIPSSFHCLTSFKTFSINGYACLYNLSFKAVEVELSNTGLRLLTTTETATIVVEGLAFDRGIMPDYEMHPTLDDFLYDEDSIMEFVINLIEQN